MFRLPVSQLDVEFLPFTGAEDVLLLESPGGELDTSVALLDRVTVFEGAVNNDAGSLPLTDFEILLLELRRTIIGDLVESRGRCAAPECRAAIEISFRLSGYIARHKPRMPRHCVPAEDPGWYRLPASGAEFRLVTAADLIASGGARNARSELARRTMRGLTCGRGEIGRIERAMEMLCPSLSRELEGRCPKCHATTRMFFKPRTFVLRELGYDASFLYQDVHLLAARYHWTEEKIVTLPRSRRLQYAELALMGGAN
jgi:hypothetical protein